MCNFENKNNIKVNAENLSLNKIKQINCLQQKKCRDIQGLFLAEGEKIVSEIIANTPDSIEYIVSTPDYQIDTNKTFHHFVCDAATLKKCSSLKTPNKVIAVVKKMQQKNSNPSFILALDSIQDPGNMGTIMRLADWFGIEKIICSTTTVDIYNPKVIQATMGAFLRVEVDYLDLKDFFSTTKLPIYGALLEGKNVYEQPLKPHGILLMGNEGSGISKELVPFITQPITIPKKGGAESLNVSMATSILLSEFFRGEF
ncbi:MAG: RNA methyltransferase [Crocinitomicaceae bacterium]|nr:RNA methyltransferase [Crocinitomicaceae bacterium]